MEYLPLLLLFAAALIAGWFYLQRAKTRDAASTTTETSEPLEPYADAPSADQPR